MSQGENENGQPVKKIWLPEAVDPGAAECKRAVLEQLQRVRADGVKLAEIAKASKGRITTSQILDILSAQPVKFAVYKDLAAALDRLAQN
jgi:hypothetical protein